MKMNGSRIKYMLACAVLAIIQTGWSAVYSSTNSGDWAGSGTWDIAGAPGAAAGDTAYMKGHSVTSSAAVANNLNSLGVLVNTNSVLWMNSGSSITATGNVTVSYGKIIVRTNAVLTHKSSTGYIKITPDSGDNGELLINGGSVSSTNSRPILMGSAASTGAVGKITINSGSLVMDSYLQFNAGANTTLQVALNGGTAQMNFITFANNAGHGAQSFTVNGGDLILTTGNEGGSFGFTDPTAKVWVEKGTITFKGVDTQANFNAFTNTFKTWVANGNVDSATLTDQQLQDGLSFNGTDAVLTVIPEPVTLGLFIVAGSTLLVLRRVM
jgi:hypothetical protein